MTRLAAVFLILWMSLCSAGCGGKTKTVIEPVMVYPAKCARPAKPELPKMAGLNFLESREAYSRLKMRDAMMRTYIAGMEDALDCYEAQLGPDGKTGEGGN